jgi:hypothetical protein
MSATAQGKKVEDTYQRLVTVGDLGRIAEGITSFVNFS